MRVNGIVMRIQWPHASELCGKRCLLDGLTLALPAAVVEFDIAEEA